MIPARTTYNSGFNCCQSILHAFAHETKISREKSLMLGTAFGAGIAGRGEICGAVTGALMVIGLISGRAHVDDETAKEKTRILSEEFLNQFTQDLGSILCRELLQEDPSTEDGLKRIRKQELFTSFCPDVVEKSEKILQKLLIP